VPATCYIQPPKLLKASARCLSILTALCLGGCAGPLRENQARVVSEASVKVESLPEWQKAVSLADLERLKGLGATWREALAEASKAGLKRAISAEGKLLEAGAGLPFPVPSPGNYLCRIIRIGSVTARQRPFTTSKPDFCYVGVDEAGRLWIDKQTGPEQITGSLFVDDGAQRLIFLGARKIGGRQQAPAYGKGGGRDLAGVLERVGALRYRLTIPRAQAAAAKLELLELTPAPIQLEG